MGSDENLEGGDAERRRVRESGGRPEKKGSKYYLPPDGKANVGKKWLWEKN